ncbi:TetR/AcrR family transcriptional regulator [Glutamicibacter sp. JL.03c]|uniref:TetR/AcrR family transcriptional regulator n=1 Tax=Glutamicibacter sp. JL.03c TaxID=2984842 RepID=UPI0021F7BF39|nr:TetR/AcrR family transcriptional regulator [Glutamicibacter sp. JL.03c]UYQ77282.1 TetR/AcrR family transcriptional regulator [Glutamicibacter sp. JL.03c]
MTGTRGTYRKTAQRREQILDAAFTLFAKNGYTASSVNEIARMVGISQTGVLHHFAGGKLALLTAVLQQRDALAEEKLQGKTGRDFLAALVEISRVQAQQRGVVQLYRNLSTEAVDSTHPAHQYFHERLRRIADAVTQSYSEVLLQDGLLPGVEPRAAALNTLAMTEGLEALWLQGMDVDMAEGIRDYINGYLQRPL